MKVLVTRTTNSIIGGAELSALAHHALISKKEGMTSYFATNYNILAEQAAEPSDDSLIWIHSSSPFRSIFFPFDFLVLLIKCLILCLKIKPDVVNPHSRDDQIIFTLLRPLFGYRVVWKNPGDLRFALQGSSRTNPVAKIYERLLIAIIKRADAIYSLNDDDTAQLEQVSHGKTNCVTVPSDILFDEYNLSAPPLPKKGKYVIGTLLRLTKDKDVETLIRAFAKLESKDAELWIVGEGEERQILESLAKELNINDSVKFWGFQNDVSRFYKSFDIFVQPAKHEPWGRNIREAKYFGLPIIGASSGGIKLQMEDGSGLLFAPGDADELTDLIRKLISDQKLRTSLGKMAQEAILREGDFKKKFDEKIYPLLKGDL